MLTGTLEANSSVLGSMLKFIDESMLRNMQPAQRNALRPLMVRPIMQAFAVAVPAAEVEANRRWEAEVYGPFQRKLAKKYPFDASSRIEAGPAEIAEVFGPSGSIATFANEALGKLVVRYATSIEPKTWGDQGIRLRPDFVQGYPKWVAPLDGAAAAAGGGGAAGGGAAANAQYVFQLLPQGAPNLTEYTVVIDGQTLRYRNTAATWADFFVPNPAAPQGVRIVGVTLEGQQVEFFNESGASAFGRMMDAAKHYELPNGDRRVDWTKGNFVVSLHMKLIRAPGAVEERPSPSGGGGGGAAAIGVTSLRGVKLPALVAGSDANTQPSTKGREQSP
jgi:type VI secretion system protein ImpL